MGKAFQSNDHTNREIALLKEFDFVRDSIDDDGDPSQMFDLIVGLLIKHFQADAAVIYLSETPDNTSKLYHRGLPQDLAQQLGQEAMSFEKPGAISKTPWSDTIALRILIERQNHIPGGLCIARREGQFSDEDHALILLAESQIDSSFVQARMIWKLYERNRELEAIYQVDRLRDDATNETMLINSFTGLLVEHFKASICLITMVDPTDQESIIRTIADKQNLSAETLGEIQAQSRDIQTAQTLVVTVNDRQLHLLAAPFIVAGQRLGSVIVGRATPFHTNKIRLMVAVTSQMDSAIAKIRTSQQLELRTRELEAIYRIDQIRDQELEFDIMMQKVIAELCRAVASEAGYIMLYNADDENQLELKATTSDGLISQPDYMDVIQSISRQALDTEHVISAVDLNRSVRSIIATPLILNDRVIGVFGAVNSRNKKGFSVDDKRMITAITSQVDTAVFERLERRRMRQVLGRSVDPKVLDVILQRADDSLLAGERLNISVLFADMRGSTEWAERTHPETLVTILNTFLGMMTDIIFKHQGTLDKFVGDEIIAIFGAPVTMDGHALAAATAALEMQTVHQTLQHEFSLKGKELPSIGIGISSGEAIVGEFGPPLRTDYTAMGRIMNIGSRLCSAAVAEQILITEQTYQLIHNQVDVKEIEAVKMKGINDPVRSYQLISVQNEI